MWGKIKPVHSALIASVALAATLTTGLFLVPQSAKAAVYEPRFPQSALQYMQEERRFIADHVLDEDGGFSFWVNRDGSIVDKRKLSMFQANIILWIGGIHSQDPRAEDVILIRSAADYLLEYLYGGDGHWFESYNPENKRRTEFFWNPRSETYIAYALFEAYRVIGDERYKKVAEETTANARKFMRAGRLYRQSNSEEDIGFRFPEHMGFFQEYQTTGNITALNTVEQFDTVYRGIFARESYGDIYGFHEYYHGTAILDKLLYAYLAKNTDAFKEGSELRERYLEVGHDDAKVFDDDNLGEVSDNGRDYYDKVLAMSLVEWSNDDVEDFRNDALNAWEQILRFWDYQDPKGFYINTKQLRKTCFSIGQPGLLLDITRPEIIVVEDEIKSLWNHQLRVVIQDPKYNWNDHELRGIGLNENTFELTIRNGIPYGAVETKPGPCENCLEVRQNYIGWVDGSLQIRIADYLQNVRFFAQATDATMALSSWQELNRGSYIYYLTVFCIVWSVLLILVVIISHIYHRQKETAIYAKHTPK